MNVFDACAQIRMDAGKQGSKGKKCPGGYWIPQKHKCGGKKKLGSPEASRGSGDDTKRRQRQVVKAGLIAGLGLTGVALAGGAGLLAMKASGGGDAPRPRPPRFPGASAVSPGATATRAVEAKYADPPGSSEATPEHRQEVVDWAVSEAEKVYSSGLVDEVFDREQVRRFYQMAADLDPDVTSLDMYVAAGADVDVIRAANGVRSKGVETGARQAYRALSLGFPPGDEIGERIQRVIQLFARRDSLYWDENGDLYL